MKKTSTALHSVFRASTNVLTNVIWRVIASIIAAGLGLAAHATVYYVDPATGNAANDGLSIARPLPSVASVVARGLCIDTTATPAEPSLCPGDVVRLRADVDHPATDFPRGVSGGPQQPVIIEPWGGARVVIDGRTRAPDFGVTGGTSARWERVAGGAPDEWRTALPLNDPGAGTLEGGRDLNEFVAGQLIESGYRLITYARIEDLRAANQSWPVGGVPPGDPRPAGGPLKSDQARKQPWTYLGPGIYWVPESPGVLVDRRGRVHLRLSPTGFNTSGVVDWSGAADPNQLRVALSARGRVAASISGQYVRLRNIVIRNGGDTTLEIGARARNVRFEGCEIQGARIGVTIAAGSQNIRFLDCVFDGGLAPWTTRIDLAGEYAYVDAQGNDVANRVGGDTNDILVIDNGDATGFSNCTFRRARGAIRLGGVDTVVRNSLFEELNDEAVQFNGASNVQVMRNLLRQVLYPFSFGLNQTGGPLYLYRNVIDQRVPVRGDRILAPDASQPKVWRYGADFRMADVKRVDGAVVDSMPRVFVYQNTFIGSHAEDKGGVLSQLFASSDVSPDVLRLHQNNLRIGVNVDLPLSWAVATTASRESKGNLWHLYQRVAAPWFRWAGPPPVDLSSLGEAQARGWEVGSIAAEPRLMAFTGQFFERGLAPGEAWPEVDYRLSGASPARAAGTLLPAEVPDPDRPSSGAPDIGALRYGSTPLVVGAFGAVTIPGNSTVRP